MKILSLTLENFGPHEKFSLPEIEGSIVGIIGQNGSGKSHILLALRALITGDLAGSSSDWIKGGKDSCTISGCFEVNNHICRISRTYKRSGTNTRSIVVDDGPEVTKAKEVDSIIETVFGIDKQTIANALFIKQGTISDILECTDSDRLEMFLKWLNLGYLQKRSDFIDKWIKDIYASIPNLSPIKERYALKQDKLDKDRQAYAEQYKALTDKYLTEEECNNFVKLFPDYKLHIANTTQLLTLQVELLEEIKALKEKYDTIYDLEKIDKHLESKKLDVEKLKEDVAYLQAELKDIERLSVQYKKKQNIDDEYSSLIKEVTDIIGFDPNDVTYDNPVKMAWLNLYLKLHSVQDTIAQFSQKLSDLHNLVNDVSEKIDKTTKKRDALQQSANEINNKFIEQQTIVRQLLPYLDTDKDICPICGNVLTAQHKNELSERVNTAAELMSKFSKEFTELNETINSLNTVIEFDINNKNELLQDISANEKLLEQHKELEGKHQKEIEDITHRPINPSMDFDKLHAVLNKYGFRYLCIEKLKWDSALTEQDLEKLNKYTIEECTYELNSLKPVLADNEAEYNNLVRIAYSYKDKTSRLANIQTSLSKYQETRHPFLDFYDRLKADPKNAAKIDMSLDNSINCMQTIEQTVLPAYAKLNALKFVLETAERELQEDANYISKLEAENKDKYEKLAQLEQAKDMLDCGSGMPFIYVKYLMLKVVELASSYLEIMGSNFVISLEDSEEGKSLSFKFHRIDGDDPNWYNMKRLSGGEKIRLSIAFILATQKLISPGLSFLALDEPSTHLDTKGINALCVLLENIGLTLNNENGQVWIIDHNPLLARTFSTLIQL